MPEYFGHILTCTVDELVPDHYNTYDSLIKNVQRYQDKPYGIKRIQKGGNGRQMLIEFDSLPDNIKSQFNDIRPTGHIMDAYFNIDPEATLYYKDFQFSDGSRIKRESQHQYTINASVLKSAIALNQARMVERKGKGATIKGMLKLTHQDVMSFNAVLEKKLNATHNLPSDYRRFRQKLQDFEDKGYMTLIKDLEKSRVNNALKADTKTVKLLNSLFTSQGHKPYAVEVAMQYDAFLAGKFEITNIETGEYYNPKDFKQLSISTITNHLRKWEYKIATHKIRSGNRQQYMQQFKPYHSLDQAKFAGSLISIDDRQPPFETMEGKRVWFYNAIDTASEMFTCWVYGTSKEGIILEFYRQLVRNYREWGIKLPYEIECESSLNSSFVDTILKPGNMFQSVRIEANNARGKRIEAFYRQLRYSIEKSRIGWLARPFAISEANQLGQGKKIQQDFDTIITNGLRDIETWNNMPHSKHPDKSRFEYFIENQNKDLKETNWQGILPFIGNVTHTSCNAGIIKFRNTEYLLGEHDRVVLGDTLINYMRKVEGTDIDIYWLDGNDGQVLKALIYKDGEYICEAVRKPSYSRATIERTPDDDLAREIMSSYVSTITGFAKKQEHYLDPLFTIDHRSKVLNNKFKIKGIQPVETIEMEVETLGYENEEQEIEAAQASAVNSWKQKFNNYNKKAI